MEPEIPAGGGDDGDANVDQTDLDILGGVEKDEPISDTGELPIDDDDGDDGSQPEKETTTEEEEKLSKLIEDELEGEEDEDIKEFLKTESPEYKDIVKKYPEFFKNFPSMRHIFFRMREMDRIFSSVEEAKEVVQRHDRLGELEQSILAGKADTLLKETQAADPKAFTRFAEDFLPQLYQTDKTTYNRAVYPIFVNALREASRAAEEHGNENLGKAANWMAYFLFNKKSVAELPVRSAADPEIEAERKALSERESRMVTQESQRFEGDTKQTGQKLLKREVTKGLDPDGVLPDFVKDAITERVMQRVGEMMDKDERHIAQMNALWKRAQQSGFSREAKARLVAAYYGRARQLVGPIRRQLVKDAVSKSSGKRGTSTTPQRGRTIPSGGSPRGQGGKSVDPKTVDWTKTSDADFMAGKVTYKKR